jgi:hypothetical protein
MKIRDERTKITDALTLTPEASIETILLKIEYLQEIKNMYFKMGGDYESKS